MNWYEYEKSLGGTWSSVNVKGDGGPQRTFGPWDLGSTLRGEHPHCKVTLMKTSVLIFRPVAFGSRFWFVSQRLLSLVGNAAGRIKIRDCLIKGGYGAVVNNEPRRPGPDRGRARVQSVCIVGSGRWSLFARFRLSYCTCRALSFPSRFRRHSHCRNVLQVHQFWAAEWVKGEHVWDSLGFGSMQAWTGRVLADAFVWTQNGRG